MSNTGEAAKTGQDERSRDRILTLENSNNSHQKKLGLGPEHNLMPSCRLGTWFGAFVALRAKWRRGRPLAPRSCLRRCAARPP
eukprot:1152478-Pleurochrysis_carterae.AAC.1